MGRLEQNQDWLKSLPEEEKKGDRQRHQRRAIRLAPGKKMSISFEDFLPAKLA